MEIAGRNRRPRSYWETVGDAGKRVARPTSKVIGCSQVAGRPSVAGKQVCNSSGTQQEWRSGRRKQWLPRNRREGEQMQHTPVCYRSYTTRKEQKKDEETYREGKNDRREVWGSRDSRRSPDPGRRIAGERFPAAVTRRMRPRLE